MRNKYIIDPKYVHKLKNDNVLLSNLRRALATHIPREIWQRSIICRETDEILSHDEKQMLKDYYLPHAGVFLSRDKNIAPHEEMVEYYILHNVPHVLEKDFFDAENVKKFDQNEVELLKEFYNYHKEKNAFIINQSVSESDEIKIQNILDRKYVYMTEAEKMKLSGIFEKLPNFAKENIFYAHMVVDHNHAFFFERPNDHIPAIMLIEAVRQLCVALLHQYLNVPLVDYQIALNSVSASFQNYLEINQPVKFKAKVNRLDVSRHKIPTYAEIEIEVLQMEEIAAVFKFNGPIMLKKLFLRIRQSVPKAAATSRYYPISSFYHKVIIRQSAHEAEAKFMLVNLSVSGFCVRMSRLFPHANDSETCEFIFCFGDIGFIFGACKLVWQKGEDDEFNAGFSIVEMTKKNKTALIEVIKKYCYILEDREIL